VPPPETRHARGEGRLSGTRFGAGQTGARGSLAAHKLGKGCGGAISRAILFSDRHHRPSQQQGNQVGPVAGDLHHAAFGEPNHNSSLAQQIHRAEDLRSGP
jgi:hypothetical protein